MFQEVARFESLSTEAFEAKMSSAGEPIIIDGCMKNWPAMEKWSFAWLRENYGADRMHAAHALRDPRFGFLVSLEDYIDYITEVAGAPLQKMAEIAQTPFPLYAFGYQPFQNHPELLEDFALPPFVENWFHRFSKPFQAAHFPKKSGWLLLGPKNTCAHAHQDAYGTITWLAQIKGTKRCLFFPPSDAEYLYDGHINDPYAPDLDRFPNYRKATGYACTLEPGSMVFLPPNWWHHVIANEPCITISDNLVNRANLALYLGYAYGDRLSELLGSLPVTF